MQSRRDIKILHIVNKDMDISKKAKNMSAADRVKQYPARVLHSDGGKLFCMSCNVTVAHYRESAVDRHENREARKTFNFALTEAFVCTNNPLEKLDKPKVPKILLFFM
ncbi:CGBP1 protein, partial [Polyodon spathula]|nr:CGBP1 protein [Polyodon spathula]